MQRTPKVFAQRLQAALKQKYPRRNFIVKWSYFSFERSYRRSVISLYWTRQKFLRKKRVILGNVYLEPIKFELKIQNKKLERLIEDELFIYFEEKMDWDDISRKYEAQARYSL